MSLLVKKARLASLLVSAVCLAGAALASPRVPEGALGRAAGEGRDGKKPKVEARLLIDASAVQPGDRVRVGVLYDLAPGWHIYWRNPGGSGLPTEVEWEIDGAQVGPLRWPAPAVFLESDGMLTTHGYAESVLLFNEAVFAEGVESEIVVHVKTDFLVCKVQCVPGEISLHRILPVGTLARAAPADEHRVFEEWAARVPRSAEDAGLELDSLYSVTAIRPGTAFRAAISVVGASRLGGRSAIESFVPDVMPTIELRVSGSRPHPFVEPGLLITLDGEASPEPVPLESRLRGVLRVRGPDGLRIVEIDLDLPRAQAGAEVTEVSNPWLDPAPPPATAALPLWEVLLLALLGGLLLNGMPCVLPVLAIKVFSIAELAHRDRREVLRSGAAYAAGILLSMLVLAVAVLALRAGGTAVGWGFQFQEPIFVAAVSTVLVVFALNLFGVFEIFIDATGLSRLGQRGGSVRRSLFEGLLAVVVATPCTAPFLSTAVGFAFASPALYVVGVFLAIGVGLAAPFSLVTLVPGWARLIPRSGMWMIQLRRGLGFALVATVVWLIWVLGRSVGSDGVALLLGFLVVVSFAAWVFGAFQASGREGAARGAGLALVAVCLLGLAWLPLEPDATPATGRAATAEGHRVFDPAAVSAEVARGRTVFVYFTADWCLTCKVNEHAVLSDAAVRAEIEKLGVVTFKADWTRRDEVIRRELARFGRAGVPMYLVYDPRAPSRPELLPELLTVDGFIEALRRNASVATARRL